MQLPVQSVLQLIIYMLIKMNKYFVVLLCLIMVSCAGVVDTDAVQEGVLTLTSDVEKVFADGKQTVTFTVMDGKQDITSESIISCVTTGENLEDATFSTDCPGEYVFKALYDKKTSKTASVTAMFASKFKRQVCVMEFTGVWCAQCPGGATILNFLVSDMYQGKVNALAFHNNDVYALPVEPILASKFNVTTYPSYVTDMRDSGELNGNGCSNSIWKSLNETETFCGPSVSCVYDVTSGNVTVKAKIASEKTMEYRLAAYVVEDKVTGNQTLGTGSVQKDYTHRHMVRKMLSADYSGDRLGEIAKDAEAEKQYSFTLDPSWDPENVSVVILAIGPYGQVNNSASTEIK